MENLFSNPLLPLYVYATLSTSCLVLGTMYLFKVTSLISFAQGLEEKASSSSG